MKILSITAQKPNSTGSGVYLTELVKEYAAAGHVQAVVAGVYEEDNVELPDGVAFYPVYFLSEKLPYAIAGMSDEMPYKSTRYCDMTEEMTGQFREAFLEQAGRAVRELEPDVILCHHLYLLTAIIRENFPEYRVYGFCHNTDLRQMKKTKLERKFIADQIRGLDHIFVPQRAQEEGVQEIYGVEPEKITRVGMGYNSEIFCVNNEKTMCRAAAGDNPAAYEAEQEKGTVKLVFAGKIAEKKGVMSLLRSLTRLAVNQKYLLSPEHICLYLAGSTGNEEEYAAIRELAEKCPCEVRFLGRLSQPELAEVYNRCDIFVLPSFFEGIPLTVIEALACGNRVVMTDLPGIADWLSDAVPGADIRYVRMPGMCNADEPVEEDLPAFEERLEDALAQSILQGETRRADMSQVSWTGISRRVLERDDAIDEKYSVRRNSDG